MSGLGGFAPISNNTVHQPAIQPGTNAQPQNIQNARNEPPQNAPAGNADEARAQSFVRSLDVLLSRAGKAAGQAVDEAALAQIVKGAKFDKATVASLRATAKAANDAMRALDGFSGAISSPSRTARSASSSPSSPGAWPRRTARSSPESTPSRR